MEYRYQTHNMDPQRDRKTSGTAILKLFQPFQVLIVTKLGKELLELRALCYPSKKGKKT